MSTPTVTVILPAFNAGSHLLPAVRSVLADGFADLELRVYDDGSSDGSIDAMASAVDDPRLVVIRQPNRGLAATLNRGLEEASGTYIARMDADDQIVPGRFAAEVAVLEADPAVVLVGGQIERIVGDRVESVSRFPTSHDEIVEGLLAGRHVVCHPSVMIRATAIDRVGGYWSYGVSEDWDLFLRLAEHGQLVNLDDLVLKYRFHATGINASSMADVRRNIRLAVGNHRRRLAGRPELAPDQLWRAIGPLGRLGVRTQTRSLGFYRSALQAGSEGRRTAAAAGLVAAAVLWPQQAAHRLRNR